ncbi:MAG: cell wall metabolism sensor histidine kinase WalK [Planctomycetes bacterium]|nr:cell wall metabolism sensor histidine kinase WalK [Planctomycetota bacterium]
MALQNKTIGFGRFVLRGESLIASAGLLFAAILLGVVGTSAWWSARERHFTWVEARQRELDSAGLLLSELAETHLGADRVSVVRRLVVETARMHELSECRIILPSGEVIAAAHASDITLASLPEEWSNAPIPAANVDGPNGARTVTYHLEIEGRGPAALELSVSLQRSAWSYWDAQSGIAAIGAMALGALLLVYRRTRARMRAMSYIREALIALDTGETELAALTIQRDLGAEAAAWNELLSERERLQQVLVTKRLLELPSSRRERSQDLASMCDAMSQGLILVDSNLNVTYANGAAGLYLGKPRGEILGNAIDSVLDPEILEHVRGVASGEFRRTTSTEISRNDEGSTGVLRFSVRPVRREDESAAMIVVEDVTQQRLADSSRNTFVAKVTHELRTPLTNILLYAETAMEEGDQDAHVRANCLNVINQEARRLDRIVGDMLSVAELEAGSHTMRVDDVHLSNTFADLRSDYEGSASEKNITFDVELPPKLPVIQADKDKIELALHNLVGNAMKYTPDGGRVTVSVECGEEDGLVVKVVDTGIGLADEELERIFEKFYRAKDERITGITGSGLGLALAREVIRLHGGDITVISAIDEGSTFVLTVPALAHAA